MSLFFCPRLNIRSRDRNPATQKRRAKRIPRCFAIPCSLGLLLWWFAVQAPYARAMGSTFAVPANDNALRGAQ